MSTAENNEKVAAPERRPYANPELVEHGSIDALTAGGEVLAKSITGQSEEGDFQG